MHEFLAILFCLLSVLGLYAVFSRIAIMLLPRGALLLTVDGRERTEEDILLMTEYARLLLEREGRLSSRVSVILSENEQEKAMTLRKEGILVYIVKS